MSPRVEDHSADLSQGVVRKWNEALLVCVVAILTWTQGIPLTPSLQLRMCLRICRLLNINQVCWRTTRLYTLAVTHVNSPLSRMTLTHSKIEPWENGLLCKRSPQIWHHIFNFLDFFFFFFLRFPCTWSVPHCWHFWVGFRSTDWPGIWKCRGFCLFFVFVLINKYIRRTSKKNKPFLRPA